MPLPLPAPGLPELVEGRFFFFHSGGERKEERPFDKLREGGFGVRGFGSAEGVGVRCRGQLTAATASGLTP